MARGGPPKPMKTLRRVMCGQRFGAAAELPLGAELYVSAGSAGDLVAGNPANRVFDRAFARVEACHYSRVLRPPVSTEPARTGCSSAIRYVTAKPDRSHGVSCQGMRREFRETSRVRIGDQASASPHGSAAARPKPRPA